MGVVVVVPPSEQATHLACWGAEFANALRAESLSVLRWPGAQVDEAAVDGILGEVVEKREYGDLPEDNPANAVLEALGTAGARLLLVAKPGRNEGAEDRRELARHLFESAPCDTILLRFGEGFQPSDSEGWRILVPTAGGPHSRAALKLSERIARQTEGVLFPLYVEPDVGAVATEVGEEVLRDYLRLADIDPAGGHVRPIVELEDRVSRGIRKAAEATDPDLLLVGASNTGTLRTVLFGTVPDRLLTGDDPMAVAVIRSAKSMTERFRARVERWLQLRIPQLTRDDRIALFKTMQRNSRWNFDFMALICLSTAIASLGLMANSAAVVIGAMLVAPLMMPLLGSGLALVQGNAVLVKDCVRSIIYGFFAALGIGYMLGLVGPVGSLTSELAARGGPTLLDLGVAFLSGVAASYCIARPNLSSALAGVAIAAALVPPIATVGISLALGEIGNALGAALLFSTNVAAIILGAAINFYSAGVRGQSGRWTRRMALGLALALAVSTVPLGVKLYSKVAPEHSEIRQSVPVSRDVQRTIASALRQSEGDFRAREVRGFTNTDGDIVIEIEVMGSASISKELAEDVRNAVAEKFDSEVRVRLLGLQFVESGD